MVAFLQALQAEGMINPACVASGVSVASVWRWRETYPPFDAAVRKFMTRTRLLQLEDNMYRIANSTDPKMAMAAVRANEFLMKAWNRDEYGDHQRIEQTQTTVHQVQVIQEVRHVLQEQQSNRLAQLRQTQPAIDVPSEVLPTT